MSSVNYGLKHKGVIIRLFSCSRRRKVAFEHDGQGRPIDFANGNIIVKGRLNRSKSKRIWQFLYSIKKV